MEKLTVGIPTGIVLPFAGANAPDGFMLCDGRSLSRAAYAGLFSVIGTAHGAPDGNTFNIPDYRGLFLRGVDGTAGIDPDKGARTAMKPGGATGNAIGSVQASQFGSHTHGVNDPGHVHSVLNHLTQAGSSNNSSGGYPGNTYFDTGSSVTGISLNSSGGSETRPRNAYVNYIIKV